MPGSSPYLASLFILTYTLVQICIYISSALLELLSDPLNWLCFSSIFGSVVVFFGSFPLTCLPLSFSFKLPRL